MSALIKADVIEPWDNYIPKDVIDDIIPSIREECTVDGKLYSWPFLLDIIGMGWHSGHHRARPACPTRRPRPGTSSWPAPRRSSIQQGGAVRARPSTAHGWRSLAPIAHSMSTNVYTPEGLFDFTSEPAIEALKLMKQIMASSNPDILLEGATDAGVNGTPDEVAFAAQQVGLLRQVLQRAAALRGELGRSEAAASRPAAEVRQRRRLDGVLDDRLRLFKYGQNKEKAAEYIKALTYNEQIWKDSIVGTPTAHPGQLPPYKSIYAKWDAEQAGLDAAVRRRWSAASSTGAKAITNHQFGLQQFVIGKPIWEKYLKGEEADPKEAMQEASDAVAAEVKKG